MEVEEAEGVEAVEEAVKGAMVAVDLMEAMAVAVAVEAAAEEAAVVEATVEALVVVEAGCQANHCLWYLACRRRPSRFGRGSLQCSFHAHQKGQSLSRSPTSGDPSHSQLNPRHLRHLHTCQLRVLHQQIWS